MILNQRPIEIVLGIGDDSPMTELDLVMSGITANWLLSQ